MNRHALLSSVSIFSSLGEREIDQLLELTTTRRLSAKEVLFRKGDPGNQLYGVMSGRLKVVAAGVDGKELVFGVMSSGDVIGDIAIADSNPRSASVIALEPSELLTLHRREFIPYLEGHPKVAIHLAGVLAGRVRKLSEKAEDSIFLPLPARMAKTLLALASSYGDTRGEPSNEPIDIRLSQQDLGDMLGTTRESVNKQLRVWEEEGLVELRRGRMILLSRDALGAIAKLTNL
jgi:CRP/FNR family cyclic AMP-dependent transcriptional regulator